MDRSVCTFVNDDIVEHIPPPFSADGFQIVGTPDDDDLTNQTYRAYALISDQLSNMGYEGSSLEDKLREVHDDHHVYMMLTSVDSTNNTQIIHAFSTGPLEFFIHDRRQTVRTSTIHIVNLVSQGVQRWRSYLQQSGQQLPDTDPALFEFPNVAAL